VWPPVGSEPEANLLDILVVCTANVARSPLLAVLLQDQADRRLGAGALTVRSAGLDAHSGIAAAPWSRWVAEGWGLSLTQHRSSPVRFTPVHEAALVLTMTLRQERILSRGYPDVTNRTFALRELLVALDTPHASASLMHLAHLTPRERVRAVVADADARRPRTWMRRRLDVADPIGGDREVYRRLGEEFAAAGRTLAPILFGATTAE
jgi:protein-tyrosine phosphatase